MNRAKEIREVSLKIHQGKQYDFRRWMRDFIVPADRKGWNWLLLSGGDVRKRMRLDFSDITRSRCKVVEVDGVPHTVLELRDRFLPILGRAKDLRGFYSLLSHIVSEEDIKQFHYDLWLRSHNLEARVAQLRELAAGGDRRAGTETDREVFYKENCEKDAESLVRHMNRETIGII